VIGLQRTGSDHRVRALRQRPTQEVLQFPQLVAAEAERVHFVPPEQHRDAAERGAQPGRIVQRGRPVAEGDAGEAIEIDRRHDILQRDGPRWPPLSLITLAPEHHRTPRFVTTPQDRSVAIDRDSEPAAPRPWRRPAPAQPAGCGGQCTATTPGYRPRSIPACPGPPKRPAGTDGPSHAGPACGTAASRRGRALPLVPRAGAAGRFRRLRRPVRRRASSATMPLPRRATALEGGTRPSGSGEGCRRGHARELSDAAIAECGQVLAGNGRRCR
jgi:hypothetical protein